MNVSLCLCVFHNYIHYVPFAYPRLCYFFHSCSFAGIPFRLVQYRHDEHQRHLFWALDHRVTNGSKVIQCSAGITISYMLSDYMVDTQGICSHPGDEREQMMRYM